MSYSRRSRYSSPPSPYRRYSRSVSKSLSRSRSRSRDSSDVENPGNNLYVTGLSVRVTKKVLEAHFSTEGKVEDVHLVVDPWTRESRGFGFVTMSTLEDADRCIKYLDGSVLEGRVITVEKARRRRGRTPTPGRYLGLRTVPGRSSRSYSPHSRSNSPRISPRRDRSRSRYYSPYYSRRRRSYSPYGRRRRSYSPVDSRGRSDFRSRSRSYSGSPVSRRDRSYSPYYSRRDYYYDSPGGDRYYRSRRRHRDDYSPDERYYRRSFRPREDYSPDDCYYRRGRYRSITPPRYRRRSRRSYSHSVSSGRSRSRSYSSSPGRDHSWSVSPSPRRGGSQGKVHKEVKRSGSHGASRDGRSSRSHSRSPSVSSRSRSGSVG